MIPKIIHRMWIGKNGNEKFPEKYDSYKNNLYKLHEDFEIMNWNNDDVKKLFQEEEYCKYYEFWKSLPIHIQKCDFARYIVLHRYGGVYVDADFDFLKNISPLIENKNLLLVKEPKENDKVKGSNIEYVVFNGFMGCEKNHPALIGFVDSIIKILFCRFHADVLGTTGPFALTTYLHKNNYLKEKYFIDTCDILPFKFHRTKSIISEDCLKRIDTSQAKSGFDKNDSEAYDNLNEMLGNYTYTKWYEGSNWGLDIAGNFSITMIFVGLIVLVIFLLIYFLRR